MLSKSASLRAPGAGIPLLLAEQRTVIPMTARAPETCVLPKARLCCAISVWLLARQFLGEGKGMTGISHLPQQLQARLRAELKPGESPIWLAQPNARLRMRVGFLAWMFVLPWLGISYWFMSGSIQHHAKLFDQLTDIGLLFCLPFIVVGIGGLCIPFVVWRRAKWTVYVITNRRAMIINGKRTPVKSYLPADLAGMEKTVRADGSGNLVLRTEHYRDSDGDSQTRTEGFFTIDSVNVAERLLEQLAQTSNTAAMNRRC